MFTFFVIWDSKVSLEEQRMAKVAITEAVALFPNCDFIIIGDNSIENCFSADSLIKNASNGTQVNAVMMAEDIKEAIDNLVDEDVYLFTILFTSKRMYVDDMGAHMNLHSAHTGYAVLESFASFRELSTEEKMYCMNHSVCYELGHLFGVAETRISKNGGVMCSCDDKSCCMYNASTMEELIEQSRTEGRGELRFCPKCRKDLFSVMPPKEECLPSKIRIV